MQYDVIIIGAGMAGLSAGIRLGMYDKKVLILEKHSIPGGLNSYYQRRNFELGGIRQFDVGLHALTNFMAKGEKAKPFSKLLKQLRLSYDDFKLCPQTYSLIQFENRIIKFSNSFSELKNEIELKFPNEYQSFCRFVEKIESHNELKLESSYMSARNVMNEFIKDSLLKEMIIAPLLIYGSAWENDMDFSQFVIMFKSIYLEGFSRPQGGVRTIINLLTSKLKDLGVEVRYKTPVLGLIEKNGQVIGVKTSDGDILCSQVFSSAGLPETLDLVSEQAQSNIGKLSFVETLFVTENKMRDDKFRPTIVFYNDSDKYTYEKPKTLFDERSAVVCFPDHYEPSNIEGEGMIRLTHMANYDLIKNLQKEEYQKFKSNVEDQALKTLKKIYPNFSQKIVFKDTFTPITIKKFTSHYEGVVYGSETKLKDGITPYKNLFIIGTDQGFLGIVGAMLSGISMANLHGLMES